MIVRGTILKCQHCGAEAHIGDKKSTRAFMITFNRFRRDHDWKCEPRANLEAKVNRAKTTAQDIIDKIFSP